MKGNNNHHLRLNLVSMFVLTLALLAPMTLKASNTDAPAAKFIEMTISEKAVPKTGLSAFWLINPKSLIKKSF